MSKSIHFTALALVALASGSCADYEIAEQDVGIRYDAGLDLLTIDLDSRGLHRVASEDFTIPAKMRLASSGDALALGRITRVAAGARYVQLLGLPFAGELDDIRRELGGSDGLPRPLLERWDALEGNVRVVRSGSYIDAAGEAAVYQRIRIAGAQDLIAWLDEVIDATVLGKEGDAENPGGKARARRAFAQSDELSWVRLTATALEVRFPVDAAGRADALRTLLGPAEPADGTGTGILGGVEKAPWQDAILPAMARALANDLGEIDLEGTVLVLRYPFGEDGVIDLPYRRPRAPELAAKLVEGLRAVAAPELTREEVLRRLASDD